ncbi:hypothetical protein YPPY98_1769, partial [Yersinia pestis PY-98]
MPSVTRLAPD